MIHLDAARAEAALAAVLWSACGDPRSGISQPRRTSIGRRGLPRAIPCLGASADGDDDGWAGTGTVRFEDRPSVQPQRCGPYGFYDPEDITA